MDLYTSTYTATANFTLAETPYDYTWSGSAVVTDATNPTLDNADYEGTTVGQGTVTCQVLAYGGTPYTGSDQVPVVNQFSWTWNATTQQEVINTANVGGENVEVAAGASTGSTVSQTYSVTNKTALTLSFTEGDEASQAAQSLNYSLNLTYTGSTTQTTAIVNSGAQPEGVCIGQKLTATQGTVIVATPSNGPGSPQTAYKYVVYGDGLSSVLAPLPSAPGEVNGFIPYSDPNAQNIYEVPANQQ